MSTYKRKEADYLMLRLSWGKQLRRLNNEDKGSLLSALYDIAECAAAGVDVDIDAISEQENLSDMARFMLDGCADDVLRTLSNYSAKCDKNRANRLLNIRFEDLTEEQQSFLKDYADSMDTTITELYSNDKKRKAKRAREAQDEDLEPE